VQTYFVRRADGRGPIKIGTSVDPALRRSRLECGSPEPLCILGITHAFDERRYHRVFRGLRVRGEWFKAGRRLSAFVRSLPTFNALPDAERGAVLDKIQRAIDSDRHDRWVNAIRDRIPSVSLRDRPAVSTGLNDSARLSVSEDGIEPPTRGFSILSHASDGSLARHDFEALREIGPGDCGGVLPLLAHSAVRCRPGNSRGTVWEMSRVRLTAKLLAALKPGSIARDDTAPGLFAECGVTGVSFKVQVDLRLGDRTGTARRRQTVKQTLGRYPALGLDEARAQALRLLAEVKAGRDPRVPRVTASAPAASVHWTIGHAFGKYVEDLAKRPGSELSQRDMRNRLERYLSDWTDLPLAELTKEMCEARQAQVAAAIRASARQRNSTGARTANAVVRDLSAVWNYAADYTPLPPASPTRRVKMIGEVKAHHEIPIAELGAWWAAVGALRNPLRRAMHRLGLLSGLRPGNLVAIERAWIHLDAGVVHFPARVMKNRQPFALPLSAAMVAVVREALAAGDVLASGTPYLFPADGKSGHVTVVREKAAPLVDCTGHALRHTWKTCARNARLPESTIEILLAHRLGGVRDTYGSLAEQLDNLREDQERVTAYVLARVTAELPTTGR
jgi:integrase